METKIPFYNLVNMFLTGLIFAGCCMILYQKQFVILLNSDFFKSLQSISTGFETIITISFFAVIYEIGFIINRIGSLIESILKRVKIKSLIILPFNNDYKKFNEKKNTFPILTVLSREYALSRTSMSLFLTMLVFSYFQRHYIFMIVMSVLVVIFSFSMRKHSSKIVDLLDK
jgi:hypothetical protein